MEQYYEPDRGGDWNDEQLQETVTRIDPQHLQTAFEETVDLWAHPDYKLPYPMKGPISLKWFLWFASKWGVARTLLGPDSDPPMPKVKEMALGIINDAFFDADRRFVHDEPQCVDDVATEIFEKGLASTGVPTSLVSKISAFVRPDVYPPWDKYARIGLRRRVAGGTGFPYKGSGDSYVQYFANWYVAFALVIPQIKNFVNDKRWDEVLRQLDIKDENPFRDSEFIDASR